jgi:hypothetical protein
MVKLFFLIGMSIWWTITPPAAVIKAFKAKFPEASQVKWSKENVHEYEADFKLNKQSYSANFNDKGAWLETESPTNFISLPQAVQEAINSSKINKATIKKLARIEKTNGKITYELAMKKGKKMVEKFYSSEGVEVKK